MKKWFAIVFLATAFCCAQTNTPNIGLTKLPHAFPNWDTAVNGNMDKIDTAFGLLQSQWQGTWNSAVTYAKGQIVSEGTTYYVSLVNLNLNNDPSTSFTAWQAIFTAGGGGGGGGANNPSAQYSAVYYSDPGSSTTLSGIPSPLAPNGVPSTFVSTPSGGLATQPGFALSGVTGRTVVSGTDTVLSTDRAAWVIYNNGGGVSVTLPQAGSTNFAANYVFGIKNIGAGLVTVTPTSSTIDGNSTLVITQGQNCTINTPDNSSWTSRCASGQLVAGGNITITPSVNGQTITAIVALLPVYLEFTPSCNNATAGPGAFDLPTSAAPTQTCFGTTVTQGALDFIDATTITATARFTLPPDWSGVADVDLFWFANLSSSNAVRWSVQSGCVAEGGAVSTGPSVFNTASAANSAYTGTANQRKTTSFTSVDMTNCAAGNTVYWKISRIGADGGDTLAATAELISARIRIRNTP